MTSRVKHRVPRWARARFHFFRSPQRDGLKFGPPSLVDRINAMSIEDIRARIAESQEMTSAAIVARQDAERREWAERAIEITVDSDGLTDAERANLAARRASRRPSLQGRREFQASRTRHSGA